MTADRNQLAPELRASKAPTRKQSFVSEFTEAGAHLPLSKNTVNSLAKFAVKADDDTISALRELLAQPDPHGNLAVVLPFRVRNALADYTKIDETDLAHWIKSANVCFHAVDELLISLGSKDKALDEAHIASRFAQGARHYRDSGDNYSAAQIKDLALIGAAAHNAAFLAYADSYDNERLAACITNYFHDKGSHVGHEDLWCHSLADQKIRDLAISSPETAAEILRVIVTHGVYTEPEILHILQGGATALVSGAI
jgi:hypothetical protein